MPDRSAFAVSLVAVAWSGLAGTPALADTAGDAAAGADQTIVVTGRGLDLPPAAAAYDRVELPRERLEQTGSGRIEDALSAVAGFQQFRRSDSRSANPSAQGVTLRALGGNATSRTLVLLDGVPQADPFFGYIPLSAIDPSLLSAARITRGGGTGGFGAGAVAGTIELLSAGPDELGVAQGSLLADDRGDTDLSASLAPRLGQGFAVVSGQWDRGEGFWTTPLSQRVPASVKAAYRNWTAGLRSVAPLTPEIELQARVSAYGDKRTLRFAGADTTSLGQDASLRLVGRGRWGFEALAYLQARDFTNIVVSSTTFRPSLNQYATPSTGWGGKLELRPPVSAEHLLRLGADWRAASGTAFEASLNATTGAVTSRRAIGGRNTDLGLFAEDDWTLGVLVLTAGLRADRWAVEDGNFTESNAAGLVTTSNAYAPRTGWDLSARGGAVLHLSQTIALRGSAYTSTRQPTLNELYRPFTVFPVVTRANAALGNERLAGFEVGLDLTPIPALTLGLTAFDNRVRHAIANVTIATNLRERRNVDAIHARGIEATAALRLGKVSLDGSLALTDAKVEASGTSAALNGMRPAQTPKVAASATLGWHPARNWALSLTLKHVGAQYEDDLQTDVLPAATTLDAHAELPLGSGVALVFRAENLTDRMVFTRNQAGSIDLGAPRTVWGGLRVKIG
ncbi:TonB-dependent receptor [Novosphingobium flavum]|uniref:TonB-dependent receptor n=1 Tax=Novosphingobium flavum TaxID=1778672 RepID=UPI001FEA0E2F|nr:TonB-dependent receptor [Novosphingobium flavum]